MRAHHSVSSSRSRRKTELWLSFGYDYKMWSHASKASFPFHCKFNLSSLCNNIRRIREMQSNCLRRSFDGHTDFYFRNVHWKSDSVQKGILEPTVPPLNNLKWTFFTQQSVCFLVRLGVGVWSQRKYLDWVPNYREISMDSTAS